jgi:hypothetical protein
VKKIEHNQAVNENPKTALSAARALAQKRLRSPKEI